MMMTGIQEGMADTHNHNNTEIQLWWDIGSGGLAECTVADGSEDILMAGSYLSASLTTPGVRLTSLSLGVTTTMLGKVSNPL